MNNINTLNNPSISGIQNLNLDQLTVSTIDSDLIYIDRIEAKEMIIDTKLTLTNTGVISVGAFTISDVELTYLDGTTSNIQTQINNINTSSSGLTTTVATHTTQISALQTSDTTQNTTLGTHTTQISALQTSDTSQNASISAINYAIYGQSNSITNLQTSDTSQNT